MGRFVRFIAAAVLPCVVLYGIRCIAKIDAPWLAALICFLCGYPFLCTGGPYYYKEEKTRLERILNLQDDSVGEVFVLSAYPGYQLSASSPSGNDYISEDGSIICTKFVNEVKRVKIRGGRISSHIYAILICFFVFLLWTGIISKGHFGRLYTTFRLVIFKNLEQFRRYGVEAFIPKIIRKLQRIPKNSGIFISAVLSKFRTGPFINGWNVLISRVCRNASGLIKDISSIFR